MGVQLHDGSGARHHSTLVAHLSQLQNHSHLVQQQDPTSQHAQGQGQSEIENHQNAARHHIHVSRVRLSRRHLDHDAFRVRQRGLPDSSGARGHRPAARRQLGLHVPHMLLLQQTVSCQVARDIRLQEQGNNVVVRTRR